MHLVCQSISGGYFIVMAQSLFANRMLQTLRSIAPDIDALKVLNTGASSIQTVFQGEEQSAVIVAYMSGIKAVFACAMASSAFAAVLSLAIPIEKLPDPVSKKTEANGYAD
jgi:MFS transporter, DHA2 family, glioxin efflux transporter